MAVAKPKAVVGPRASEFQRRATRRREPALPHTGGGRCDEGSAQGGSDGEVHYFSLAAIAATMPPAVMFRLRTSSAVGGSSGAKETSF